MGIYISLKDYDNAIEFLQKTSSYNDIYNNINTVLNNLDYNILKDIRTQLVSSRDIINNTKYSITDITQRIKKNKENYEAIEAKTGSSVLLNTAVNGIIINEKKQEEVNNQTNIVPQIAKLEAKTGGTFSNAFNSITTFATDAISGVKDMVSNIGDAINNTYAKVCENYNSAKSKVATFFNGLGKDISDFVSDAYESMKCVGASIANVVIGLSEGVAWIGEVVTDACSIIGTAVESIFTGIYDAGQWINSLITGEDWESATVKKWERRIEKVKVSKVADAYDNFYQNNKIGQWLDANAVEWCKSTGAVYELAKNIGYIAGVVGLSILTFGVAGGVLSGTGVTTSVTSVQMAATAAFAGFGKGAESAWQQGASITEGLKYGSIYGAWEGLQFYIGGKIGSQGGFGDQIANKLLSNSATAAQKMVFSGGSRIVLDSIDSALEGFVQPILQTLYADGYYNENGEFVLFTKDDGPFKRIAALFDDNGGWENVGMQALIGGIGSTLGELGNLRRFLRPTEKFDMNINSAEVGLTTGTVNGVAAIDLNANQIDLDITQPLPIMSDVNNVNTSGLTETNRIPLLDIPEEHAYTQQIAKYQNNYKKYKNTNLPADAVIDNVKTLKKYGSTPKEALENIAKVYGKDSIEYMTATGTIAQIYLKSVPPGSYGGIDSINGLKATSDRILNFYSSLGINATDATQFVINASKSSNSITQKTAEDICQKLFADSYKGWDNVDSLTTLGMKKFTGGSYSAINTALRTGDLNSLDVDLQNQVKALYKYLDESPGLSDTTLMYRGQSDLSWIADGQLDNLSGQKLVDAINALGGGIYDIADNGFESSTPVLGQGFTYKDIVEVTACPEGTKGAYVGDKSSFSKETEWLLNAGQGNKKVILGSELIDGKVYVYTQLIVN